MFCIPVCMCLLLAGTGQMFVADAENRRVCVFNEDGVFARSWLCGTTIDSHPFHPSHITVIGKRLYVCDRVHASLQVFE